MNSDRTWCLLVAFPRVSVSAFMDCVFQFFEFALLHFFPSSVFLYFSFIFLLFQDNAVMVSDLCLSFPNYAILFLKKRLALWVFLFPAKKTSKCTGAESGWAPFVWGSLMVQL